MLEAMTERKPPPRKTPIKGVSMPDYERNVLESVCMNASAELGRRFALHEIVCAALMVASRHHGDFREALERFPMTRERFLAEIG